MTSASDYFATLKSTRDKIAQLLGVEVQTSNDETRRMLDANLAISGILAKDLVDHGVLTDAQLQASLTDAADGADGSVWANFVPPIDFEHFYSDWDFPFGGEDFETGPNGAPISWSNSLFAWGQVGDSLLPGTGSVTFDNSTSVNGLLSMKCVTSDGYSRAMRSWRYIYCAIAFGRFYFKATAPPFTSGCRIIALQRDPVETTNDAAYWPFEIAIDSTGKPTMITNGVTQTPGVAPPNICNGAWWRIEFNYDQTVPSTELRLYTGANLLTTTLTYSYTGSFTGSGSDSLVLGQPRSTLTAGHSWTTWYDTVDFEGGGWIGP